jgi:uncharacterized protein (DUF2062 family)
MTMRDSMNSMKQKAATWLVQGVSPRRLALTLALGFAIGCIPVIGIPTFACVALALALRLNLPAIQAANYLVMPLQLVLIVPFVRMGGWLFSSGPRQAIAARALLHLPTRNLILQWGSITGQAMLAWLVIAVPAVLLMTLILNLLLRRIPALSTAEAGD